MTFPNKGKGAGACLLAFLLTLSGCAGQRLADGGAEGRFYTYVDAQGQLVTVERPVEQGDKSESSASAPEPPQEAPSLVALEDNALQQADETFRAAEDLEAEYLEQDRQRFVTYVDEQGQIQRQEYDKEAARQAREGRPALSTPLASEIPSGYVETVRAVTSDCCLAAAARAVSPELDVEYRVRLRGGRAAPVALDGRQYPAVAYRLPPGATGMTVRTYAEQSVSYLHPQALFLHQDQRPILLVDNLFETWFEPNWYRHGYLEGVLDVPDEAEFVVLFLPYAPDGQIERPQPGTVLDLTRVKGALLGVDGDMTVRLSDEGQGNPAR